MKYMAHPYETDQGGCAYCGSPEFGDFVLSIPLGDDSRDAFDDYVSHWVCNACDSAVHGGHGDEWTKDERDDADRMWVSIGKASGRDTIDAWWRP